VNEFLLIHIGSRAEDPILWIVWSRQEQEVIASGELPGAEALTSLTEKATNRPIYVLVPSSDLIFRTLTLPGRLNRQTRQALPFMLEETVATDIDQLHLHILDSAGSQVDVVAVEHQLIDTWLSWFTAAKLAPQRIIPDTLALPVPNPEHYSALQLHDQWLFRKNIWEGASIDASWLPVWIDSQEQKPLRIQSFTPAPANSEHAQWTTTLCELPMQLLAENLPPKSINLLQGIAHTASFWKKHWRYWRIPAFLAGAWLVLLFSTNCIEYMQLKQQKDQLQQDMILVYHHYFPQEKRIINPRIQLKQHLGRLQSSNPNDFIHLLATVTPPLKQVANWQLQSLSYDQTRQELHIQFTATDDNVIEAFKKALPATYTLSTNNLQNLDKRVTGELVIRSKS
jgi:general secretion pathway protein L